MRSLSAEPEYVDLFLISADTCATHNEMHNGASATLARK